MCVSVCGKERGVGEEKREQGKTGEKKVRGGDGGGGGGAALRLFLTELILHTYDFHSHTSLANKMERSSRREHKPIF